MNSQSVSDIILGILAVIAGYALIEDGAMSIAKGLTSDRTVIETAIVDLAPNGSMPVHEKV